MPPRNPQNFIPNQPRTYELSLKAILSFPFRICNPPPAVGKVRSCSVTPLLNVRLEDVLDRKHLPPLGLKDFEEWLLFVELSPENLYFILWLREYKQRYNQWKSQPAFQGRNAPNGCPLEWPHPHSSHLAMFYARAKQTFLTPGSEYELNLTTCLLAPFHKANNSPHPDPAMFIDVELETYRTLEASLRRFVHAQLNNVGNKRVLCGLIAGIIFSLIGAIPPLATSIMSSPSRWPRLAAIPGLWLGLTIILASINGVCMGVYVFGDLRQLRKFELSRPPISKPQPLPAFRPRSFVPNARPLSTANSILPIQQPAKPVVPAPIRDIPHPVRPLHHPSHTTSPPPTSPSMSSARLSGESERTASTEDNIYISPAYYDDEDYMDGCDFYAGTDIHEDKVDEEMRSSPSPVNSFTGTTAGFIRPFEPLSDDDEEFDRSLSLPAKHQAMTPFNFDSLPSRPRNNSNNNNNTNNNNGLPSLNNTNNPQRPAPPPPLNTFLPMNPIQIPCPPEPAAPSNLIVRMQERCNIARWRLQTGYLEPASPSSTTAASASLPPHPSSPYWSEHPVHSLSLSRPSSLPGGGGVSSSSSPVPLLPSSSMATSTPPRPARSRSLFALSKTKTKTKTKSKHSESDSSTVDGEVEAKVHKRFRLVNAVPAFAVPLTRVLSPVIARGQWEIVVRSALVGFVLAWTIVGSLLAVPTATATGGHGRLRG